MLAFLVSRAQLEATSLHRTVLLLEPRRNQGRARPLGDTGDVPSETRGATEGPLHEGVGARSTAMLCVQSRDRGAGQAAICALNSSFLPVVAAG